MSHYEERLEKDMTHIQETLAQLAIRVETSVKSCINATIHQDTRLAYETIILDSPINQANEEVSKLCYAFIARHYPSAGHLRRISSILRVCVDLERIGDKSVTICRKAVQLSRPLGKKMKKNVKKLGEEARHMLNAANSAFQGDDADLAATTAAQATQANKIFDAIFDDLIDEGNKEKWPLKDLLGLLSIFDCLERVTDHSKNICEDTMYVVRGETKQWPPVHMLFLEKGNDYLSLMAEAIGKKSFPKSARFSSAGLEPVASLDPEFLESMERHSIDFKGYQPKTLDINPKLENFTIAISLDGPISAYFEDMPYHVVALEWDLQVPVEPAAAVNAQEHFDQLFHELSDRIYDLMEVMRGKDAI